MRIVALLLIFPILGATSAQAAWESSLLPSGFVHESSLTKATDRAAKEGKAVVVYYTRTQCPPCDALQSRLRKESVGAPYRDKYVFTAVWGSSMGNSEREQYRNLYGVQGAPTWLFFTPAGGYLCTARGGFGSDEGGIKLHDAVQTLLVKDGTMSSGPQDCITR